MTPLSIITMVTDALSVTNALMPLLQQQMTGKKEVTDEDVKLALAGKDAALERFDTLIAERQREEQAAVPTAQVAKVRGKK